MKIPSTTHLGSRLRVDRFRQTVCEMSCVVWQVSCERNAIPRNTHTSYDTSLHTPCRKNIQTGQERNESFRVVSIAKQSSERSDVYAVVQQMLVPRTYACFLHSRLRPAFTSTSILFYSILFPYTVLPFSDHDGGCLATWVYFRRCDSQS